MKTRVRKCPRCGRYTLFGTCPGCSGTTVCPVPPRFSPDDPYGKYRRITIREAKYGKDNDRQI